MADRILRAGWGYWDVTEYTYGGCFRRPKVDLPVTIIPGHVAHPDEVRVRFENGRIGVVKAGALKEADNA